MRIHHLLLVSVLFPSTNAAAQSQPSPPLQVYAGYSWLSNSFNGTRGARQALNGWNGGAAFRDWHHLRFKLDYSMFRGVNKTDPQHAFLIMGGGQYETTFHREGLFAEALLGEAGLNGNWFSTDTTGFKNGHTGSHASLAEFLGGGVDTPIGSHVAFRVEGGVQHTNFVPISPLPIGAPYHLAGIPNYFGRFSAGIVWLPRPGSAIRPSDAPASRAPVESDLVFEGLNSVGHFKILANSWWSYLSTGGIEYDRHSWGTFMGARRDYSAEIMPVVILRQPRKTDLWGNPQTKSHQAIPGLGVYPIGIRLLWRDADRIKPFFIARGGLVGYTQKAFSQDAAYENFSLDYRIGLQVRVSERVDIRGGFGILHQSDGFVVPSNPGLDEMNVSAGVSYRLGGAAQGK